MGEIPPVPPDLPPLWGDADDVPEHTNGVGYPTPERSQSKRAEQPSHNPRSSLVDVFARWKTTGPLIHEPTGIAKLDELTGGGPVYGSRWYALGAPDAGKTALFDQFAHTWAQRGVAVGVLAVDEEDEDQATRLVQRTDVPGTSDYFRRQHCEERNDHMVTLMSAALCELPIVFYDETWTIEAAAADLAAYANSLATKAALFVDSIQAVTCDASRALRDASRHETISANVRALRTVATRHRLIALATSEMGRDFYRSVRLADGADDMAGAKESGAVEYSARVMISLRSVKDEKDLIETRVVKNKHGPSYPREPAFYLRLDRERQTLTLANAPPPPPEEPSRQKQRAQETEVIREQRRIKQEADKREQSTKRESAEQAERDRVDAIVRKAMAEGLAGRALKVEVKARAHVGTGKAETAIARCKPQAGDSHE